MKPLHALTMFLAGLTTTVALGQPAVPLVTHDPYFSVWSMRDRLNEEWPKHWTGATMGMCGLVRVDGQAFRWCGAAPSNVPAAEQRRREVTPTRTVFVFAAGGVDLQVTFRSPVEPGQDLKALSRSVSAVLFTATSTDGRAHDVEVYLDVTGEWCSDSPQDQLAWSRLQADELGVVSMGTTDQPTLKVAGDWRTIDWGRVYLAAPRASKGTSDAGEVVIAGHERSRSHFIAKGGVTERDDARQPRAVGDDWPVLAASVRLGSVSAGATGGEAPAHVLIGYDDGRSIELFERALRPLWKSDGGDMMDSLLLLHREVGSKSRTASDAETRFVEEATRVGGAEYAKLVSLAYRQVLAGHKLVADWDGTPLMFSKENTSNGCIATIDVIYPASPFYLYHDPEMLKASLRPLLQYSQSPRWKFPFAPHDMGTYPKANGQVYGGGERTEENQMPVEESGNMLIMLGALAKIEGNAEFSRPYLPMLEAWAEYLKQHGLDPANQLCTDDFAGHLARNANLSAKTCIALGAYSQLLKTAGKTDDAARWRGVAEEYAKKWLGLAGASAAGPTVLVFGGSDKGTWSQKYNLVWDRALGLNLFPTTVFENEVAWYKQRLGTYGLPLDSRMTYTKLDWSAWSACLTQRRADFDAIMAPSYAWINVSPPPTRVPMSDWFETTDGKTKGMHTRTVVGGLWMPLLMDKLGAGWR